MIECMNLELEKISRGPEGYTITHSGAKQRSVKMNTKFLLPQEGGFAAILAIYLEKVKTKQEIYTGKVWYIGRTGYADVHAHGAEHDVQGAP